jgi:protocatechuate 3,4-dioxygenase beta subunit
VGLIRVERQSPTQRLTIASTITDAEGRYRLTDVPAGNYRISPLAPGYVVPGEKSNVPEQGRALTLNHGENVEKIDFNLIRGGVITGKVIDPDNKPLIKQTVTLWRVDEHGQKRERWAGSGIAGDLMQLMFYSDDRGVYRIFGVPPGRYLICAGVEAQHGFGRLRPDAYRRTYYADAVEEADAKLLEVTPGSEHTEIDLRLGRKINAYSVNVRVVEAETGKPLSGVRVNYERLFDGTGHLNPTGPGALTDQQGEARFEGLATGSYWTYIDNPTTGEGEHYSEPMSFEVTDSEIDDLVIRALRAAAVSGSVIVEGSNDPSVLAQLSNIRLQLVSRPDVKQHTPYAKSVTLQRDGSFRVGGLRPSLVSFSLRTDSNAPKSFSLARVEHNGVQQSSGIPVIAGQQVNGIRIVLAYGNGILRGQVRVVGGTLPEDAAMEVGLQMINPSGVSVESGKRAVVDSLGRFAVEGLAAGTYEVWLRTWIKFAGLPAGAPRPPTYPNLKQRVNITAGNEASVNFVLDLSKKEGQ